jgi:hypothetical protein
MRRMRRTHPALFPLFRLDRIYWDVELQGEEFHVTGAVWPASPPITCRSSPVCGSDRTAAPCRT